MIAKEPPLEPVLPHHAFGGFRWVKAPSCCERLVCAFENRLIFVSGLVGFDEFNVCYLTVADADGYQYGFDGSVTIQYCPWCGNEIKVRKEVL